MHAVRTTCSESPYSNSNTEIKMEPRRKYTSELNVQIVVSSHGTNITIPDNCTDSFTVGGPDCIVIFCTFRLLFKKYRASAFCLECKCRMGAIETIGRKKVLLNLDLWNDKTAEVTTWMKEYLYDQCCGNCGICLKIDPWINARPRKPIFEYHFNFSFWPNFSTVP